MYVAGPGIGIVIPGQAVAKMAAGDLARTHTTKLPAQRNPTSYRVASGHRKDMLYKK